MSKPNQTAGANAPDRSWTQYQARDVEALGDYYIKHVEAMTAERLHSKADIAAELAHRDKEISRLRNVIVKSARKFREDKPDGVIAAGMIVVLQEANPRFPAGDGEVEDAMRPQSEEP